MRRESGWSRISIRCRHSVRSVKRSSRVGPVTAGVWPRPPYDAGGLSGGAMERPALQRLLAEINRSLVHVVVVYKVDRPTRSLADFAKMVEVSDARGVSLVAVTPAVVGFAKLSAATV